jgi:uncharacterized protein with HEPN domain
VRAIGEFTSNRNFESLLSDKLLRSGVYWQFALRGEALSQLRRLDQASFDRISESSRIVGFRNQIIHGYEVVQDNVTWQIVQDKLPVLRRELEGLLSS